MQSHIIFNKYITDTNPLKLGYVEIWGVGSVSISSVSISASGMVITPTFTYNPASQVCDPYFPILRQPEQFLPTSLPNDPLSCRAIWEALRVECISSRQPGGEGKLPDSSSLGTESLEPYLPCVFSCLQIYIKLCLDSFTPPQRSISQTAQTTIFHQIYDTFKVAPLFHVPR